MKRKNKTIPLIGEKILRFLVQDSEGDALAGDFGEVYQNQINEKGIVFAKFWYWYQVSKFIPFFISDLFTGGVTMFISNMKFAIRNFYKNKMVSLINLTGLSISLAFSVLIFYYAGFEFSFDNFHKNKDNIFRINQTIKIPAGDIKYPSVPVNVGPLLTNDYPEILNYTRLYRAIEPTIKYENDVFTEDNFVWADTSIFDVFDFELLVGDEKSVLRSPNSLVLTEETALKYFGNSNPIGNIFKYTDRRFGTSIDLIVSGIMKNIPANSHIQFDFLGSFAGWENVSGYNSFERQKEDEPWWVWTWNPHNTYLLLNDESSSGAVSEKLGDFVDRYFPENIKNTISFSLIPLNDIHLKSDIAETFEPAINRETIIILLTLAVFILIISIINYVNLTTAMSIKRSVEIGIKKVIGAKRHQLFKQYMFESVLMSTCSVILAIVIANLLLAPFNDLTGRELSLHFFDNMEVYFWLVLAGIIVGVISGIYPSVYLSGFKPIDALKRKSILKNKRSSIRNAMVLVQFTISIVLMVGTLLVSKQVNFLITKDLGFNKNNLLFVKHYAALDPEAIAKYDTFQNELLKYKDIIAVTSVTDTPGEFVNGYFLRPEGLPDNETVVFSLFWVEKNFADVFELEFIEGKDNLQIQNSEITFLLNEQSAKKLGWDDPIGKRIDRVVNNTLQWTGTVAAVVKDFHFEPVQKLVDPLILAVLPEGSGNAGNIVAKVVTDNLPETISKIESLWEQTYPGKPFDYFFLDDRLNQSYRSETELGKIINVLTILGLFIAIIGLFSLSAYTAEQRTKEIGIRKTLGASVSGLTFLLNKEFLALIVIANIAAYPIAFIALNNWLEKFPYRVTLDVSIFIISTTIVLLIAILTVSFHSFKTALTNPVKSLRYE